MAEKQLSQAAQWDHEFVWHPFTQMQDWLAQEPVVIERGEGVYLIDENGKKYYDGVSSLWVNIHGHNHPALNQALKEQVDKIAHSTLLGLVSPPSAQLCKELVELAPDGLNKVFLSDDEVLWWAKGGVLKGESPKRIAYLKEIVDAIPGAIEPWQEYHDFDIQAYMEKHHLESMEELQNSPLISRFMNPNEVDDIVSKMKDYNAFGHVGEDYYIGYYGRHCNGIAPWKLPEDHQYKIEIIDMWNMTRDVTMTGVSGRFDVKMPGKEGIAVLASRID